MKNNSLPYTLILSAVFLAIIGPGLPSLAGNGAVDGGGTLSICGRLMEKQVLAADYQSNKEGYLSLPGYSEFQEVVAALKSSKGIAMLGYTLEEITHSGTWYQVEHCDLLKPDQSHSYNVDMPIVNFGSYRIIIKDKLETADSGYYLVHEAFRTLFQRIYPDRLELQDELTIKHTNLIYNEFYKNVSEPNFDAKKSIVPHLDPSLRTPTTLELRTSIYAVLEYVPLTFARNSFLWNEVSVADKENYRKILDFKSALKVLNEVAPELDAIDNCEEKKSTTLDGPTSKFICYDEMFQENANASVREELTGRGLSRMLSFDQLFLNYKRQSKKLFNEMLRKSYQGT